MNYQINFLIFSTLTYVFLALIIVFKGEKNISNRVFAIKSLDLIAWSGCILLFYISPRDEQSLFFIKLAYVSACFIASNLLFFSFVFPAGYFTISVPRRLLIYVPTLILGTLFLYSPLMIQDVTTINGIKSYSFGPWINLFNLTFLATLGYAFYRYLNSFKTAKGLNRVRLQYFIYSAFIALILAGSTNLLLPTFFHEFRFVWLGPPLAIIFSATITYAIFKYQFIDTQSLLKKGLIYTVTISSLSFVFLILYLISERYFQSLFGYQSIFVTIISASILALVFIPLKNFLQTFIDEVFYKGGFVQIAEQNELLKKVVAENERYKILSNLAKGIIHEIRNPLCALKGYAFYLDKHSHDHEFVKKFSKILDKETDKINETIEKLLFYSTPEPLKLVDIDMNKMILYVIEYITDGNNQNKIEFVTNFLQEKTEISADYNKLYLALYNIIINAVEAMPAGGRITISIAKINNVLTIQINDTGCGIPEKDIAMIYDPFFSLKENHIGLGLSSARAVIEQHKGYVYVSSKPARGSTFTLKIPLELSLTN